MEELHIPLELSLSEVHDREWKSSVMTAGGPNIFLHPESLIVSHIFIQNMGIAY